MNIEFSLNEARVIGCLLEKEITTPDQYPLSLNALTNACNQKTNREPVLDLSEAVVQQTVDSLMKKYMVSDKTRARHRLRTAAARTTDAGRVARAHQSIVRVRRCRSSRGHAQESDDARGWPLHRPIAASRRRARIPLRPFVFRTHRVGGGVRRRRRIGCGCPHLEPTRKPARGVGETAAGGNRCAHRSSPGRRAARAQLTYWEVAAALADAVCLAMPSLSCNHLPNESMSEARIPFAAVR